MNIHFAMGAEYHKQHFVDIKAKLEERGHICSYEDNDQEVAIMSDAGCTILTNAKKLYNMNHNLCSKNTFWIHSTRDEKMNDREKGMTHLVPSKWYVERLNKLGRDAIAIGCPRLDKAIGIEPIENRAFYINTCHRTITSHYDIGKKIYELPYDLKVKYHPYYAKQGGCIYDENINQTYPDSCKDGSIEQNIAEAQVVISDYATASIDSVMMNRPTILYYNKCYGESIYYNTDNVEIIFSKCAHICFTLEDIKAAAEQVMGGVDEHRVLRQHASEQLWDYKGTGLDRIAEVIENG